MAARLAAAGCVAPEEEAEELVAAAPDPAALESLLHRRERGEPLAWITGLVRFCGHPVRVDRGVYVPRPQTEELARRAAAALAGSRRRRAVDLCTGTGAVAVHLRESVPGATVAGVDIDGRAVRCARRNGVPAIRANLAAPLGTGTVDVLTAVAPYVPTASIPLLPADVRDHEPRRALDGGPDGLHVVRRIVTSAARVLAPAGWLLLEIGGAQDQLLAPALDRAGFTSMDSWHDPEGDLRGLSARAPVSRLVRTPTTGSRAPGRPPGREASPPAPPTA